MEFFRHILDYVFYGSEGLAALVALLYLPRLKNTYWKYFAIYLVFIFLSETLAEQDIFSRDGKVQFYNYLVIPAQFLFFYWLYAAKLFKRPKLFYAFSVLYILSFIPHEILFNSKKIVFSLNYTLGSLFLLYLVILEYYRQVNSSNILNFSDNRFFYINWGVTVFYIGTLPLFSFWSVFAQLKDLFSIYYIYFQISGIVMYTLFAVSFILGKENAEVWKKQSS